MVKPAISSNAFGSWVIPFLLGILSFYLVCGPDILAPRNIGWLQHGDPATHYLGWVFFRQSEWTMPIGLNPSYGLEISNAIIYSDSIPLFAISFKLISNLLPDPFQYFGIWVLLCFILQALFGWKIASLISRNTFFCTICTCFFAFSPPMIWRLNQNIGHISLVGHFLLLAALLLALSPRRSMTTWYWAILIGLTAAIHVYFLAMVAAIWLADSGDRLLNDELTRKQAALEIVGITAIILLVSWQIGVFSVLQGAQSEGYGIYKFNLAALIDPGKPGYGYWSYLLPDLSGDEGYHEGFNYLGLGILLLIPPALFGLTRNYRQLFVRCRRMRLLIIALIMLAAFSITPQIGIASHQFGFTVEQPLFLKLMSIFRSSARMFWPAYYAIYIGIFWMIVHSYRKRIALPLLGLALAVQLGDGSAGWLHIGAHLKEQPSAVWTTPLRSPFWACAATRYRNIRTIAQVPDPKNWSAFAYYAAEHRMGTDIVYLARYAQKDLQAAAQRSSAMISTGRFDRDSLYVLDLAAFRKAVPHIDSIRYDIGRVDNFFVIAPVLTDGSHCPGISTEPIPARA
jgi:hypothetical protein